MGMFTHSCREHKTVIKAIVHQDRTLVQCPPDADICKNLGEWQQRKK